MRPVVRSLICSLACFLAGSAMMAPARVSAETSPWYLRAGLGWTSTQDLHLRDEDCANRTPPALFGCVAGIDGRPLGAYGALDETLTWDLGVGYRLSPRWRVELGYAQTADQSFSGRANFLATPGPQPVSGELTSRLLLGQLIFDLPVSWERVTPWVGLEAGWVRHETGRVTYAFPGLAPQAVTVTQGGERDQPAWRVELGIGVALERRLTLDLSWSYADLGWMGTDAGSATIVRSRGTRTLEIDGTEAQVRSQTLRVGLRYGF